MAFSEEIIRAAQAWSEARCECRRESHGEMDFHPTGT
jgi:hypothetical protein